MSINCKLVTLVLVLILEGQVLTEKIYGGHKAVPHSRPYMALLERHMQGGQTKYCGGFLLNEDFVMTAAHCQANSFTVQLGVHNIQSSNDKQSISVEQIFPHKKYNASSYKNDIMLLKLRSKAHFNKNVKPIALAAQDDGSLPKSCIVSGWGRINKSNNYMSPVLMEVNVTLIDNKLCAMDSFYCSTGEAGPGEGDSGGPLVCEDGKAYGVVSSTFIPHSGSPMLYRYSKIPEYRNWIKLTMKYA